MNGCKISKREVVSLAGQVTSRLEEYANHIPKDRLCDMFLVGERMTIAMLDAVRNFAGDVQSETEMVGEVIYGMMHAALMGALSQPPASAESETNVTVN